MKHFTKICEGINVAPLLAQLDEHFELWDEINYRRVGKGTPHSEMTDIWCRYDNIHKRLCTNTLEQMRQPFIPMWYPSWEVLTALHPIVFDLMAMLNGEMLGGIFITRIPPGGKIKPHVDDGWHCRYFTQFYVSLKSARGADFFCEHAGVREFISPQAGECWGFKNTIPHWVNNDSASERITAIIAIRTALFE